jgi:hypothetical protein
MEWLRLYVGTLDNAKVQALPGSVFKAWVNCLCLARITDGILPPVDVIAFRLRCGTRQAEQWRDDLVERRLIDVTPDGNYRMHDWDQHQYVSDDSTKRVRKHREKHRGNVSVTPPDTEQIQIQSRADTDTEKRRVCVMPEAADLVANDPPSERFEEAWSIWPLKVEKDAAGRAWLSVVTKSQEAAVFACINRYRASDQVARAVVQKLAGWLFQGSRDGWAGDWPPVKAVQTRGERRQEEIDREWGGLGNGTGEK